MQLRARVSSNRGSSTRPCSDSPSSLQPQCPSSSSSSSSLSPNHVTIKKRRLSKREENEAEDAKKWRFHLLHAAFGPEDHVNDSNWLTGSFIDLMLWKFATLYPNLFYLSTAFYHLHLETTSVLSSPWRRRRRRIHRSIRDYQIRDVLGRLVDYTSDAPLVFIVNVDQIHWNLFRVQLKPTPELQLFEPTGRLALRSGITYRSVPRIVIEWLNVCYPQHKGWLERTVSAITNNQQVSGFDCGVACLLYADKCGRGQSRDEINEEIDQQVITSFRKQLQLQRRTSDDEVDA